MGSPSKPRTHRSYTFPTSRRSWRWGSTRFGEREVRCSSRSRDFGSVDTPTGSLDLLPEERRGIPDDRVEGPGARWEWEKERVLGTSHQGWSRNLHSSTTPTERQSSGRTVTLLAVSHPDRLVVEVGVETGQSKGYKEVWVEDLPYPTDPKFLKTPWFCRSSFVPVGPEGPTYLTLSKSSSLRFLFGNFME